MEEVNAEKEFSKKSAYNKRSYCLDRARQRAATKSNVLNKTIIIIKTIRSEFEMYKLILMLFIAAFNVWMQ